MAPQMATGRLRKELTNLKKDPPPGIIAEPDESDILTWHYAIKGPPETPFQAGTYIGKIKFPSSYPMKPPSIMMLTPSGRFAVNTRLCLSMSDFHPESWNPLWSVSTILQGVQSFMASEELTTGGLQATDVERRAWAEASTAYNSKMFVNLFDGNIEAAFSQAEEARLLSAKRKPVETSTIQRRSLPTKDSKEIQICNEGEKGNEELTAEEIEKRKQRNAKKRAKQKAKKFAAEVDHV